MTAECAGAVVGRPCIPISAIFFLWQDAPLIKWPLMVWALAMILWGVYPAGGTDSNNSLWISTPEIRLERWSISMPTARPAAPGDPKRHDQSRHAPVPLPHAKGLR